MKLISKIYVAMLGAIALGGCTKLNEETFASLSPSNFYNTPGEALASVAGLYQAMGQMVSVSAPWTIAEIGTDEFVVPGRASGGWYDQNNIDIMLRQTKATNNQVNNAWTNIFTNGIGKANGLYENLNLSAAKASLKNEIAETRALRAYFYFYALDFWGNVPIVTTPRLNQENLPTTSTRADVFKFVETELLASVTDLPSVTTVNKATYYPRLTKEAVYTLLATLYLNAEVYTGTARWTDAVTMANNVINTNAFALEANVVDNFKAGNKGLTKETIFAASVDPARSAGTNPFILYSQPAADQQRYNLNFTPANGFSTMQAALDRYENQDNRKKLLQYGPQTYPDGRPLLDAKGVQLNLVNVVSYTAALDNEGYRVLKYVPEGATYTGGNGNNDLVLTRYADVLLIKAEGLFRTGNTTEARTLLNQVRSRSNASTITTVTLKDFEDERGREFIWEGHRRRDMIRFGDYFTGTWTFKTTNDPATAGLYPIPSTQIATNPNLKQNPGY